MSTDLRRTIAAARRRMAEHGSGGVLRADAPAPLTAEAAAGMIDHTLLRPDATGDEIRRLCAEARDHGFATVCVNPVWAGLCAGRLSDSAVRVCTVVGFPLGATLTGVKAYEAERMVASGAAEVDMVMDIGALKGGDVERVRDDIAAVAAACHDGGAVVKVIIETVLLTRNEIVAACVIAQDAGTDFVKTSTGFGGGGATVEDVALMRSVVGPRLGVKASGGIRTSDDALAVIGAGADRIGTSSGVRIVEQLGGAEPR